MKVDGPNIGQYLIAIVFNGVIKEDDIIIGYFPNTLVRVLEDFANEVYKSSHVKIFLSEETYLEISRFYCHIMATFSTVGSDEKTHVHMNFHIDDFGNIKSITIAKRMDM